MAAGTAVARANPTSQALSSLPENRERVRELDRMLTGEWMFPPGGESYEGRWRKPESFPVSLRPLAEEALVEARAEAVLADKPTISKWLASLAVLCAGGNMTAEDAKAKLQAYAAMFDGQLPASILTRSSLDEVARKFKFLPSYGELAPALSRLANPVLRRVDRLETLLALPPPEPPWTPPSDAEKAAVTAMVTGVMKRF